MIWDTCPALGVVGAGVRQEELDSQMVRTS